MKSPLAAVLFALFFSSCALFSYGTGRFNPINADFESAFTITPNDTHYLRVTLPAFRVAEIMPPVLSAYPPQSLVRPYAVRRVALRDARWQTNSAPSGWSIGMAGTTMDLELRQSLGVTFSVAGKNQVNVFTDLNATYTTLKLSMAIPASTAPATYPMTGAVLLNGGGGIVQIRLGINVLPSSASGTPKNGELSTNFNGNLNVVAGGSYTVAVYLPGAETQFFGGLASAYIEAVGSTSLDAGRVRGDEWRVTNAALPARWELEWLEGNVGVQIEGQSAAVAWNRIRTAYSLSYTDLRLLLGLRAIGASIGQYEVSGQLSYRDNPVGPIRWAVTVK